MSVSNIELKTCPFCGGEAMYKSWIDIVPILDENGAYVDADTNYYEKTGCQACDIWFWAEEDDPEDITIERWNRRVQ